MSASPIEVHFSVATTDNAAPEVLLEVSEVHEGGQLLRPFGMTPECAHALGAALIAAAASFS